VQLITNWILYNIWEGRYDARERAYLRGQDKAYSSLKTPLSKVELHRATLVLADIALRATFRTFATLGGFPGYHLPDMNEIAKVAHEHYDNHLRGGEGHMEVGKFILNVLHNKSHMTLSVKPFGCMPSSGISDGVQSLITARYPQSLFCAIETSGDGKVNVQSRVQMSVFKARIRAMRARSTVRRTPVRGRRSTDWPRSHRSSASRSWRFASPRFAGRLRTCPRRRAIWSGKPFTARAPCARNRGRCSGASRRR